MDKTQTITCLVTRLDTPVVEDSLWGRGCLESLGIYMAATHHMPTPVPSRHIAPTASRNPSVRWWEVPRFPEREMAGGSGWADEPEKSQRKRRAKEDCSSAEG